MNDFRCPRINIVQPATTPRAANHLVRARQDQHHAAKHFLAHACTNALKNAHSELACGNATASWRSKSSCGERTLCKMGRQGHFSSSRPKPARQQGTRFYLKLNATPTRSTSCHCRHRVCQPRVSEQPEPMQQIPTAIHPAFLTMARSPPPWVPWVPWAPCRGFRGFRGRGPCAP